MVEESNSGVTFVLGNVTLNSVANIVGGLETSLRFVVSIVECCQGSQGTLHVIDRQRANNWFDCCLMRRRRI